MKASNNQRNKIVFLVILFVQIVFTIFIQRTLYPIRFTPQNFFFFELIETTVYIPEQLMILLNAGNLILLWLAGRRLFKDDLSLIAPLIYAISPWANYLTATGSFYIYLLFLTLIAFNGLLLIRAGQKGLGSVLIILGFVVGLYSSALLVVLPLALIFIVLLKMLPLKTVKFSLVSVLILTLPLLLFMFINKPGLKNILTNEIRLFSDPGLINNVNTYQGAAREEGLGQLARLSENKYLFSLEHVFLKVTKQLTPSTYFTQQEKLLSFSFSPPLYLGFLFPFLYGLYLALKSARLRKGLFVACFLIIPSVLSHDMVDLNRLVIVSPLIVLIISYGLITMYKKRKNQLSKVFLFLTLLFLTFQILVTLTDINLREKDRYLRYFEQNYNLGKQ